MAAREASVTRNLRRVAAGVRRSGRLAGAVTGLVVLVAAACGGTGSSGSMPSVGDEAPAVPVPDRPIPVAPSVLSCVGEEADVGCVSNPAPIGSTFQVGNTDLLITYLDSRVSVEPNPDYGSPLAIRFYADFVVENTGSEVVDLSQVARELIIFDIAGRNRDTSWTGTSADGIISPGSSEQLAMEYGLATRGWDIAQPWAIGITSPIGGGAALEGAPIDLGGASDSYAPGPLSVVRSASADNPEDVVQAFHRAIQAWDIEAMCAQLSSQAQVHFTGRLVGGECSVVISDIMGPDWENRVRSQYESPEVVELWLGGDDLPDEDSLVRTDSDNIYAVVKPSAGPYSRVYYDFAADEGGVKIHTYLPLR